MVPLEHGSTPGGKFMYGYEDMKLMELINLQEQKKKEKLAKNTSKSRRRR